MKTNSRWSFVCEGLKQAGWIFGALLLLGVIGWIGLNTVRVIHNQVFFALFGLTTACSASVLIGPVPTLLTFFDISDKRLLMLSCMLIIPYWACLGTISGLLQQLSHDPDANQQPNLFVKQAAKRIRWTIAIGAFVIAAIFFVKGPIAGPNYISNGRYSAGAFRNAVINNLRQVDAARNEFILEKKPSPDHIVTEADLTSYIKLNSDRKIPRLGPERYVLNPIDKPVYVIFESDWRFPRRGWREGFTFTNGTIFQLP
jgi:hypothetical protein